MADHGRPQTGVPGTEGTGRTRAAGSVPTFRATGEGAPLLLLPGIGQGEEVWETMLPRLSSRFCCLTFDPRGAGTRRSEVEDLTLDDLADDAAAVVRSAGRGPAAVLGWSMGGAVAQRLAVRCPGLVRALVLVSTMARRTELQEQWTTVRLLLAEHHDEPVARELAVLPWLFTPALLVDSARALGLAQANARYSASDASSLRAQATALTGFDDRPALRDVDIPALVLVGAEDLVTPVRDALELAGALPRGELEVLPRGGHGMLLEQPAEVLKPVLRFLRERIPR